VACHGSCICMSWRGVVSYMYFTLGYSIDMSEVGFELCIRMKSITGP
jgi:hypothetical protein